MRHAGVQSGAVGRLVLVLALLPAASASALTLTRGPYLQLLTTRSVTVVWNTDIAANCSLRIGPVGGTSVVLAGPAVTTVCAVPVDGLTPGQAYSYVPFANGVALRDASVFRADHPTAAFRVGVVGDTGTESSGQFAVRDRMLQGNLDLIVHTGDMIYEVGSLADQNPKFFEPYADLVRQMVFWPLLGNHDVETQSGGPWRQVHYTPANNPAHSENYYSFDHGNAHFVVLDSNASTSPGSPQYLFLDQDLAASTATWKFVFFHHPAYAAGSSDSSIRNNLVPVFDRHRVDIVLMGHVHNYSRTKPLRDGQAVAAGTGTVYVVTGGGGASLAGGSSSSIMAYVESTYHYTRMTIDGPSLLLEMIRSDGRVRDTMTLAKGGATTTTTTTPATTTTTTTTLPAGTVSMEVRVAASADDAEERATGSVNLTSSDLELVHDSDDQTVGLRFVGVDIPSGATIVSAHVQFTTDEVQTEATSLVIRGQAVDNPLPFTTAAANVSARARTTAATAWSAVPGWSTLGETGSNQRTPDLAPVIQEIVSRTGWARGNALVLIVTGTGHRTALAADDGPAGAPLLRIYYRVGTPPSTTTTTTHPPTTSTTPTTSTSTTTSTAAPTTTTTTTTTRPSTTTTTTTTLPSGSTASVEVRVSASADDAEERATGSVDLSSSDLELVHDSDDQTVGLRFRGVDIPPGATIVSAWVQFTTDEVQNEVTSLMIRGEAADNPLPFTTAARNISGRTRTGAATSWAALPAWSTVAQADTNQRTPELAPVIQEVVARSGWARGNALVLIVTGTGHRTARAVDGNAATAPMLHVDYGMGATPTTTTTTPATTTTTTSTTSTTTTLPPGSTLSVNVRVAASADDAEERANGSIDLSSSDLELVHDKDDQTVGMRFAGVDIPPGATIVSAYVQFTTDEVQTEPTSVTIHGQATDSPLPFAAAAANISARPRTAAATPWTAVPGWSTTGEAGSNQRTPDLAPVVQEIVGRAGWARGNALALIVTGTGHRTARAVDGNAATAPLLHVVYR